VPIGRVASADIRRAGKRARAQSTERTAAWGLTFDLARGGWAGRNMGETVSCGARVATERLGGLSQHAHVIGMHPLRRAATKNCGCARVCERSKPFSVDTRAHGRLGMRERRGCVKTHARAPRAVTFGLVASADTIRTGKHARAQNIERTAARELIFDLCGGRRFLVTDATTSNGLISCMPYRGLTSQQPRLPATSLYVATHKLRQLSVGARVQTPDPIFGRHVPSGRPRGGIHVRHR